MVGGRVPGITYLIRGGNRCESLWLHSMLKVSVTQPTRMDCLDAENILERDQANDLVKCRNKLTTKPISEICQDAMLRESGLMLRGLEWDKPGGFVILTNDDPMCFRYWMKW